jgi:mevalonate kinase
VFVVCVRSIPNPKEHLSGFVDKVTQLDEKVSEYLVPQLQEVSGPALRFFQKMKMEQEVEQEWASEVEEKLNLSQQAVEELNKCTKKVKELLDTFQDKTNLRWPQPQTNWRTK